MEAPKAEASYNPNVLCTDAGFTNYNGLTRAGIQSFLASNGSFLTNFSQNGKTAAQMISDAARAYGINPIAILATIQKEEGLISGFYSKTENRNQVRLDWAMGYGYTDSQIYTQYKGFSTQIDVGTWQLRRNYDYWATNGSDWNVGKNMIIDGTQIHFNYKCTSALYRYTPHLGGNKNFSNYFEQWGGNGYYGAQLLSQGPRKGLGIYGIALLPGQQFSVWVNFKNTGNTTWYPTGATPVQLGTAQPFGRGSPFFGGSSLRGRLSQGSVPPGGIGTFWMTFTAPSQEGTYVEHFQPVAEYVTWMNADVSWTYTVSRGLAAAQTNGVYIDQGPKSTAGGLNKPIAPGQTVILWVRYLNTGRQTWFKNGTFATHIGTTAPDGRGSVFFGGYSRRGQLVETQVPPGSIGTFQIRVTAPSKTGRYNEHFRPVMEYVRWFGTDMCWQLTVR